MMMIMTPALLVANLIVSLLLVMVVGYIWRLMTLTSVVLTYVTLYLNDEFEDFGSRHFEDD